MRRSTHVVSKTDNHRSLLRGCHHFRLLPLREIHPREKQSSRCPPVTTSEHGTNGPSMTHSISTRDSQSKEGPPQETPEPHVHTHTESHHHPAVTHSEDGTTSQTSAVARYTEGPYKGMTYEQAQKYYQWLIRHGELQNRLIKLVDKEIAHADAIIQSSEERELLMLSALALLSPEQRETLRQEALKTAPASQVDAFFDDLANHSTTKTPDQILKETKELIDIRTINDVVFEQLRVESEQLRKEFRESEMEFERMKKGDFK